MENFFEIFGPGRKSGKQRITVVVCKNIFDMHKIKPIIIGKAKNKANISIIVL